MEEIACTICLETLQPDDLVILLVKCRHFQFHYSCATKWFENGQQNCPLCRDKAIKDKIITPIPLKRAIEVSKRRKAAKLPRVDTPNDRQEYQTRQDNVRIRMENINIQGSVSNFIVGSGNVIEIG